MLDSAPSFCLGQNPMRWHTRIVQGNLDLGGTHDASFHCIWRGTYRECQQSSHQWCGQLHREERNIIDLLQDSSICVNQKHVRRMIFVESKIWCLVAYAKPPLLLYTNTCLLDNVTEIRPESSKGRGKSLENVIIEDLKTCFKVSKTNKMQRYSFNSDLYKSWIKKNSIQPITHASFDPLHVLYKRENTLITPPVLSFCLFLSQPNRLGQMATQLEPAFMLHCTT